MRNLVFILFLALFTCCGSSDVESNQQIVAVDSDAFAKTIKYSEGDPFIETIKKSEFFKVSGLEDKVIETTNGTIISIPKGAFRDQQGNIIEKEVIVEITDISSFEEQFNANINSPTGQNILLNGGALYINATADGDQLNLNDNAPIYIETIQENNPDLLVFEGIRNDKGEMHWINHTQPKKHLVPVDLEELDFLPDGFANVVEKNMPFGNYKTTTKGLIDSLYYILKIENEYGDDVKPNISESVDLDYQLINAHSSNYTTEDEDVSADIIEETIYCAAINPASIKVIKGDKFKKTFIATKQFEERLHIIHKTRDQNILEVYTSNLEKDLAQCDSLAANLFNVGSSFEMRFSSFSKENWGNIENLPRSVRKLGEYYSKKLKKTELELLSVKTKYEKALAEKWAEANKIEEDYKKLLTKRQNYRMNRHGFTLKKTGWVATGIVILETFTIDLTVNNGADFDRVHVYTIDPRINSIFSWQSIDKVNFNYAFPEDVILIYKKGLKAKALVVAYKSGVPYFDQQEFKVTNEITVDFTLKSTTEKDLNKLLSSLDTGSKKFNNIKVDLAYQRDFYLEKLRLKKVMNERKVIAELVRFVYQCSSY